MAKKPPDYVVVTDDVSRKLTAEKLARLVRQGFFEGHELVRGVDEPAESLRPLHRLPLFQQVHGLTAEEAAGRVEVNIARGFVGHLVAFVAVMALLGPQWWMIFWGMGLASHGGKALGPMKRIFADGTTRGFSRLGRGEKFPLRVSEPVVTAASEEAVRPPELEFEVEPEPVAPSARKLDGAAQSLQDEWSRLDTLAEKLGQADRARLTEARGAIDRLLEQRAEVQAHLADEDGEALAREAAELETDLAGASDARTREALSQALQAVGARRKAVSTLQGAQLRLDAQARTVMHQLRSLRLALVSRGEGGQDLGPALADLTAGAQLQVRSAAELEEALAEARIAPVGAAAVRSRS